MKYTLAAKLMQSKPNFFNNSREKHLNTFLKTMVVVVLLNGCANSGGARMGLFSATAPVLAILHDDLFVGEAVGYLDRTGTIDLTSAVDATIKCVGEFRYTGSKTGHATVQCNDGASATLSFNSLGPLSGYGYGASSRGPSSFTYGLSVEEAQKYLRLPEGKRISRKQGGLRLENNT